MSDEQTRKVIEQFNQAFQTHDPSLLKDVIAPDCRLENSGPAPDGSRHAGYDECLAFWTAIAANEGADFIVEEMWVAGDRSVVRWTLRWGGAPGDFVRGVNVHRLSGGQIVESFGYVKG
ncbi:nuclear transport factor 2 family protein [Streptomyces sp. NPDC046805]|uniref:nuclear transport factor 2 family protein n=1 Tax=Streptomyces sp. NPDC046805 TaxID=3155134 RepID=UPI0033F2D916